MTSEEKRRAREERTAAVRAADAERKAKSKALYDRLVAESAQDREERSRQTKRLKALRAWFGEDVVLKK